VIDVFLRYHGLVNSRGLQAYPMSNWNRPDLVGDFKVGVKLHPEMLMGKEDGIVSPREQVEAAETALAWVLWALFTYSPEVGLELRGEYPPFW
jgi:hypothetical protein